MSLAVAFLLVMLVASAVALVFALNTMVALFRFRVPYVSTPQWAIDWLCNNVLKYSPLLSKERGRGEVHDLGCGDARVLIALKKKFPAIKAIGYEHAWFPYLLARWRTHRTGVTVRYADFYQADLGDATIVFCFLIHGVMTKVERLLRAQLKPGAVVYSYGFTFPSWQPTDRILNPHNPTGSKINVYRQ